MGNGKLIRESCSVRGLFAFALRSLRLALRPWPLRRMLAAGVITGLLPLIHAHSFISIMLVRLFWCRGFIGAHGLPMRQPRYRRIVFWARQVTVCRSPLSRSRSSSSFSDL